LERLVFGFWTGGSGGVLLLKDAGDFQIVVREETDAGRPAPTVECSW